MEDKIFILISGKKGTGKSHLSELLVKEINAEKLAFADPLKVMARPVIEELGFDFYDTNQKEMFRPILQAIGNAGRTMDGNFWINKAMGRAEDSDNRIVIFDDVRFVNELKAFDDYKVIKIRSNRKSVYDSVDNDISETELDTISSSAWDVVFDESISDKELVDHIVGLVDDISND